MLVLTKRTLDDTNCHARAMAREFQYRHVPRRNHSDSSGSDSIICRSISGGRIGRFAVVVSSAGAGDEGRSVDGNAVGGSLMETGPLSGNKLRSFLDRGGMGSGYCFV
jgi:hypothetical protein